MHSCLLSRPQSPWWEIALWVYSYLVVLLGPSLKPCRVGIRIESDVYLKILLCGQRCRLLQECGFWEPHAVPWLHRATPFVRAKDCFWAPERNGPGLPFSLYQVKFILTQENRIREASLLLPNTDPFRNNIWIAHFFVLGHQELVLFIQSPSHTQLNHY